MKRVTQSEIAAWTELLGNIAKFASATDPEGTTIEERYFYQSVARSLLPRNRIRHCHRHRAFGKLTVDLLRSPDGKRASFANLQTCCSVWDCKVCAWRISEIRREELTNATNKWIQAGNTILMATYTIQHRLNTRLRNQVKQLKEARRNFKSGRAWQSIKEDYHIQGSITATEVTFGANGWHTHLHELLFLEGGRLEDDNFNALTNRLRHRWQAKLKDVGAMTDYVHGVDLQNSDQYVSEYIAKFGHEPVTETWGMNREITKAATSKTSKHGITPRGFLLLYSEGIQEAGLLFREYSRYFKGIKQLVWSKGLSQLLGMDEIREDAKLHRELGQDEYHSFASIEPPLWHAIIELDNYAQIRPQLLKIAKIGDTEALRKYLTDLGLKSYLESGNLS